MGRPGDRNWRDYVGLAQWWDKQAALQFTVLVEHGLRGHHKLCDVGCGSLRAGRLFIPYLDEGCYCGIEPEQWLVEDGIKYHVGSDLVGLRHPRFITGRRDFPVDEFGVQFDYVLAQSVLTHTGHDLARLMIVHSAAALAPGGKILATWQKGSRNFEGCGWQYPQNVSYTSDFMEAIGTGAGLCFEYKQVTVQGLKSTWGIWERDGVC